MNVLEELKIFYEKFGGEKGEKGEKNIEGESRKKRINRVKYANCEKGEIGRTAKGTPIYYFAVKKTERPVIIAQYSIHAREYICTYLCMMQIKDFLRRGRRGTVYFIPAANPDGIAAAIYENPLFKANANGVDLNVNFDARWGTGEKNVFSAGAENYVGKFPFSENETRALRDFTLKIKPQATLSYHSKGEEIYWEFHQDAARRKRDYEIAKAVSLSTGYPLLSAGNSAGGYKDWCVEKLKIPAVTIEAGSDALVHPIGKEHAKEIFMRNAGTIEAVINALAAMNSQKKILNEKKEGYGNKIYARGDKRSNPREG